MKSNTIRILVIIGLLTVAGLASVQFYLLRTALDNRREVFDHAAQIALFKVVGRLNNQDMNQMPQISPVIKKSNDYYIVDVNRDFNCEILEFYLISEFERAGIFSDFEYAVYDCYSDAMIYGNYVKIKDGQYRKIEATEFNKHNDLVYYFVVYFPSVKSDILGSLKIWIVFASIFVLVLIFIIYSIWVVLEQKRFSELQRDFIQTMTHEFSTPLAASSVAIEYFQQSENIAKDKRLKKYTELIQLQNERLKILIDKLLNTNKTNESGMEVRPEKIKLYDLCNDVVSTFKNRFENAQIIIDFQNEDVVICSDIFHSSNILHALIDNALKYSGDFPEIAIRCRDEINFYRLSIADSGIGIAPKYRKKIFRKFFRVPTGNIHNVKGFGLGLYYVKILCKRMKWKIKIDNQVKNGTTFHLIIPGKLKQCP